MSVNAGDLQYDVVIVGYGPVGQLAAIMLGRRGYRVGVYERWSELYPLPRAVVYDDEIARVLAQEGLLEDVGAISASVPDHYEWRNRSGDALLKIDWSVVGPAGRPVATFFSQPELQAVLDRHARATPGVEVHTGWEMEAVEDAGDVAAVTVRRGKQGAPGSWVGSDETRTVRCQYVLGADGANSSVRRQMGVPLEDLGFQFDWLIVDVLPQVQEEWSPMNWQLCDPARPTTIVSGGPGRRRWEFMRLPGETVAELNTPETAWRLMGAWGRTPENSVLERHAVYTFEAKWATQWRRGRLLLAGDAAHLMPPFAGQGMCAGLRDVANLVWKLDLVLSGRSDDHLLDTYGVERSAHVQHFIHMSVALGRVICVLDDEAAAERDARMIAGGADPSRVLPAGPPPRLGPGVLGADDASGLAMVQGRVARGNEVGLLDELVAPGLQLITTSAEAAASINGTRGARFADLGGAVLLFGEELEDVDGFYADWLTAHDAVAVLVRPDSYVYALASTAEALPELVDELLLKLTAAAPALTAG